MTTTPRHTWAEKLRFAQRARGNPTLSEARVWEFLQTTKSIWARQQLVAGWVADFLAPEDDIVLEVDGAYHYERTQFDKDRERDEAMMKRGYSIVRMWADVIEQPGWERALKTTIGTVFVMKLIPILAEDPPRDDADVRVWIGLGVTQDGRFTQLRLSGEYSSTGNWNGVTEGQSWLEPETASSERGSRKASPKKT